MGTQQLLLIAIGVILVGVMIIAGILYFNQSSQESNRNQLVSSLYDLCVMAKEYYKKPTDVGGGGGSFNGFTIPTGYISEEVGTVDVSTKDQQIDFYGKGVETGDNPAATVSVVASVNPDSITIRINN